MPRKNSSRATLNITNPGLLWVVTTFYLYARQGITHRLKHSLTEWKKTNADSERLTQPYYKASGVQKMHGSNT
eukprot:14718830-Ditylum_brightwellii.AAC.1